MSFRFIEDHRDVYPVRVLCDVLEVSPAGYYAWRVAATECARGGQRRACGGDPAGPSGQRRTLWQPPGPCRLADAGTRHQPRPDRAPDASARHSRHLAPPRRVRTTDSRHALPIAPNLLARDFTAAAPNRVWLADITYIPTDEGWLYLAVSSTSSAARSSAGRCAITCAPSWRPPR